MFNTDPVLTVRTSGVEFACWLVGSTEGRGVVGSFDLGGGRGVSLELWLCDATGKLFRGVLIDFCGIGGRADVGGSAAGRESTGSVVAIEADMSAVTAKVQPVQLTMCLPSIEDANALRGPKSSKGKDCSVARRKTFSCMHVSSLAPQVGSICLSSQGPTRCECAAVCRTKPPRSQLGLFALHRGFNSCPVSV